MRCKSLPKKVLSIRSRATCSNIVFLVTLGAGEQEKLEELARDTVQSAQQVDICFERAKILHPVSPADEMKKEIEDMEAVLKEKEALLQKSLDQVIEWDKMLSKFRDAQGAILIPPKPNT